jgi:hypothetical protein
MHPNKVPIIFTQGMERTIVCGLPGCADSFLEDDDLFDHWQLKHGKVPT